MQATTQSRFPPSRGDQLIATGLGVVGLVLDMLRVYLLQGLVGELHELSQNFGVEAELKVVRAATEHEVHNIAAVDQVVDRAAFTDRHPRVDFQFAVHYRSKP